MLLEIVSWVALKNSYQVFMHFCFQVTSLENVENNVCQDWKEKLEGELILKVNLEVRM
jgi:hypothetical protein